MNHAALGQILSPHSISIPQDLLSPLAITEGVIVWGMYYPRIPDTDRQLVEHDLVISPIPFHLWGKSARMIVRTKHQSGAFKQLTNILVEEDVSILVSEATRSDYNYDTWTLLLAFDSISHITYDEKKKAFIETDMRITILRERLIEECQAIFYVDDKDPFLKNPLFLFPHNTMAHFYSVYLRRPKGSTKGFPYGWAFFEQFTLSCKSENNLVSTGQGEFASIIEALDSHIQEFLPCGVFAEMNLWDRTIRTALIPNASRKRVFGATVKFIRTGPPPTSKGVINTILSGFPDSYQAWGLTNVTEKFSENHEEGRNEFMIFDESSQPMYMRQDLITKMLEGKLAHENITKWDVNCFPIDAVLERQNVSQEDINQIDFKNDVFISYSTQNEHEAFHIRDILSESGFRVFLSGKSIDGGDKFGEKIRQELLESRDIIILYSAEAAKSDWVKHEYGAAWVLDKRIIPVTLRMRKDELPKGMDQFQAFEYHDVDKEWLYLEQLQQRLQLR